MKLLTEEQALALKPGDRVNVYFFTPRRPSANPGEPLQWDGREVWFESVWFGEEVASQPHKHCSEDCGVVVKLTGRTPIWNARKMELVE